MARHEELTVGYTYMVCPTTGKQARQHFDGANLQIVFEIYDESTRTWVEAQTIQLVVE